MTGTDRTQRVTSYTSMTFTKKHDYLASVPLQYAVSSLAAEYVAKAPTKQHACTSMLS